MRIVYCTVSVIGSSTANYIQVSQMIKAFRDEGAEVFAIFKSYKKHYQTSESQTKIIYSPAFLSRVAHYLYLIQASLSALRIFKKKNCDVLYTRSITIAFICSLFLSKPILVELHSSFANLLEKVFAKWATHLGVEYICITKKLASYIQGHIPNAVCYVQPDGHSARIVTEKQLTHHYQEWPETYKPKVGYFGSLSPQKGECIIKELIQINNKARFYLFTLNKVAIEYENLIENTALTHANSLRRMNEMDFLILTVMPQKKERDISEFTSPLKLFEYSATGKTVLVSNVPVLHEIASESEVVFCENNALAFSKAINDLSIHRNKRKTLSKGLLRFASLHTWKQRARNILQIIVL